MEASIQPTNQNTPALFSSDPAAIAAAEQARAHIQTAFLVAMQKPRDLMQARADIIEACKRPRFAEDVFYSKPVGGKEIVGPTVRFAEEMIRAWRNVMTQSPVIYEDDDIQRIRVTCIDLETNTHYSKEMQIRKTVERKNSSDREVIGQRQNSYNETVYIVKATDDELHNKVASAISKAVRNEGLRLVPSDVISDALNAADETLAAKDAEDPKARLKVICDNFTAIGVKPKHLSEFLGHALEDPITPAELKRLRATYKAISEGGTTWSAVMEHAKTERGQRVEDAGPTSGTDALKQSVGMATTPAAGGEANFTADPAQEPAATIEAGDSKPPATHRAGAPASTGMTCPNCLGECDSDGLCPQCHGGAA